jgi:O-acetyl-ADP-ribose deacetylase (regulator of RNase III)
MQVLIHHTTLVLLQGDITAQKVDAIVNAANSRLAGGGGVDGAIHRAGGPAILAACRKIGGCPTGSAVITTGGNLFAPYVIHTVGPVYHSGASEAPVLLRRAYKSCLNIAEKNGIKSIAFPSISTGAYGYPIAEAAQIALSAVIEHITGDSIIEQAVFVLYSSRDFDVYKSFLCKMTGQSTETVG